MLQLYCQENSLKYRLRYKLLIDDIHMTITEGLGCVAEGTDKKKKKPTPKKRRRGMYCSKLFGLVQPWNILADVDLPTSRAQFFSQVRSASGKASERTRALLVSRAKSNCQNKINNGKKFR